jgi:hypothetical protein
MEVKDVKEEILRVAKDGRLTCNQARSIAERLGVGYRVVGIACDELGVKIRECELGCFA